MAQKQQQKQQQEQQQQIQQLQQQVAQLNIPATQNSKTRSAPAAPATTTTSLQKFTKNSPNYMPPPPSTHPSQNDTIDVEAAADLANVRAQSLAFNRAKEGRPKIKFNDGSKVDFLSHMAKFDRATDVRGMDDRAKITELSFYFEGISGEIVDSLATQTDAPTAYANIRAKLTRFFGKQADALNEMVDKTMNGRRINKSDFNAHTAILCEIYRINVAANERYDVTESRKREWISRLLYNRLEYMKETFHEEENERIDQNEPQFTFTDFIAKLERRVQTLSQMSKHSTSARIAATETTTTKPTKNHSTDPAGSSTCDFCTGPHPATECPAYARLTPDARAEKIKEKRLCFRCLSNKHATRDCQIRPQCDMCSQIHMPSLHGQTRTNPRQYAIAAPTAVIQVPQAPLLATPPIDAAAVVQGAMAHTTGPPDRSH